MALSLSHSSHLSIQVSRSECNAGTIELYTPHLWVNRKMCGTQVVKTEVNGRPSRHFCTIGQSLTMMYCGRARGESHVGIWSLLKGGPLVHSGNAELRLPLQTVFPTLLKG